MTLLVFYAFAALAVGSALVVIGQRNPTYSAFALIVTLCSLSAIYGLLSSPFIAVLQIVVYAGAIMVLFLFVVMLLNAPHEETEQDERLHAFRRQGPFRFGVVLAVALAIELTWALTRGGGETGVFPRAAVSSVREIGKALFTEFAFPFEVTSILILVAMVGAVVLAKRDGASAPPRG
jgi:NADH-quinone oxidoreductase subunit J